MAKLQKIISVGNSYAITINRKLCRLMRIDHTTQISMTIEDGDTILIRPVRTTDRTGQPDRHRMYRTMKALIERHNLSATEFALIRNDNTSWRTFLTNVQVGGYADLTTVARLVACLQLRSDALRTGEDIPWQTTIDTVREMYPDKPRPPAPVTEDPATEGLLSVRDIALASGALKGP